MLAIKSALSGLKYIDRERCDRDGGRAYDVGSAITVPALLFALLNERLMRHQSSRHVGGAFTEIDVDASDVLPKC